MLVITFILIIKEIQFTKKLVKHLQKIVLFQSVGFTIMVNPNSGVLLVVASRLPQNTVKNQINFLKVHDILGKVTKFGTSRPHFFIAIWKKCGHNHLPPIIMVKKFTHIKWFVIIIPLYNLQQTFNGKNCEMPFKLFSKPSYHLHLSGIPRLVCWVLRN